MDSSRQVCIELNDLYLLLQDECTCPEMKAGEWLYLCASHETPKSCSALEYMAHTLDQPIVPSQLQPMARRLYRIFAHAYFHHREVYSEFEMVSRLYQRFCTLGLQYGLLDTKTIIIPSKDYESEI